MDVDTAPERETSRRCHHYLCFESLVDCEHGGHNERKDRERVMDDTTPQGRGLLLEAYAYFEKELGVKLVPDRPTLDEAAT